jgi:two-component system CheB/CheR fusion protein
MANTGKSDARRAAEAENIDLRAVLRTIRQPLLVLDGGLVVERANEAFLTAFRVSRDETEGRRLYDLGNGQWSIADLRRLLKEILPREREVSDYRVEHDFDGIGRRTMLLNACRMEREDGATRILLTIEDITERERLRWELEGQKEYAEKIVDASRNPLLILGWDLRVKSANEAFYDHFGVDPAETEGRLVYELGNGQWDIPKLRELLENVLPDNDVFDDFRVDHGFGDLGRRSMMLNARKIDHMQWILLEIEDRTEADAAAAKLREATERQEFLLALTDALRDLTDSAEITHTATRLLGEHLSASRAYYVEWPPGRDYGEVFRDHAAPGLTSLAGRYPVDVFRSAYDQLSNGRTWVVPDAASDADMGPEERQYYLDVGVAAWVDVPLTEAGDLRAALCLVQDRPRDWTRAEIALAEETAERCRAAIARGHAEAQMRETQEHYDHIVAGARDYAIFTMDEKGCITTWPPGAAAVFGWTAEEMIGSHFAETFTDEDRAAGEHERELETAARTGSAANVRWHCRKDRKPVYIDGETIRLGPAARPRGFIRIGQDTTARRRAEERIEASEARLHAIFEGASVGLSEIDPSGRLVRVNDELGRILGRTRRQLLGLSVADVTHPDDLPGTLAMVDAVMSGRIGGRDSGVEKRYLRPDGSIVWAHSRGTLLSGNGKGPGHLLVVTVDLTERRAAEAAMRDSEERFRQFGDASSDALWIRDAGTLEWEYLSPAFDRIYGVRREDALASRDIGFLIDLVHPDDREATLSAIRDLRDRPRTYEYRIRRPSDGEVRWLRTTGFRLCDPDGRVRRLGGITHDATEERQTADRMEVLLAELQHRTRNLVGVVRSMASRTLKRSASLEDFGARFGDRLEALARVNGLLSRLEEGSRVTFDDLVEAELRGHGLVDEEGYGRQIEVIGARGIGLPSASVQTLALALHELLTNAAKYGALSSPEGRLCVAWEVVKGDPPRLRFEWRETGIVVAEADPAPRKGGYGRELIERALPYQLGAETTYALEPDGLRCVVLLPLPERRRRRTHEQ